MDKKCRIKFDAKTILTVISILFILADMIFIFDNSSQTADESNNESGKVIVILMRIFRPDYDSLSESEQIEAIASAQNVIRTAAHFIEYVPIGFFGVLIVLLHTGERKKKLLYSACVLGGGIVYALSDEIHQLFTDGRAFQLEDICIDSLGCLTGILAIFLIFRICSAIKNRKKKA